MNRWASLSIATPICDCNSGDYFTIDLRSEQLHLWLRKLKRDLRLFLTLPFLIAKSNSMPRRLCFFRWLLFATNLLGKMQELLTSNFYAPWDNRTLIPFVAIYSKTWCKFSLDQKFASPVIPLSLLPFVISGILNIFVITASVTNHHVSFAVPMNPCNLLKPWITCPMSLYLLILWDPMKSQFLISSSPQLLWWTICALPLSRWHM